jgi:hypothetical protein
MSPDPERPKRHRIGGVLGLLVTGAAIAAGTLLLAGPGLAAVCTNGSSTDCNPAGSTLNPAAAFVDPSPPAGFAQCAGFINTSSDDVRWDWEMNCAPDKDGPLFVRVFNDNSGAILAGARLFDGVGGCFGANTLNYRTDSFEGDGLLDNLVPVCGSTSGTTFPWHTSNDSFCSCSRPGGGSGSCNDIFTANAADNKILYVGGNSTNHNYEAVYGPPGGKGTCSLINEIVRLRVAVYVARPGCFVIDAIDDEFSVVNDGATADFLVLANDECSNDTPIAVVEMPGDLLPDRGGSATTDGATVSYTPAAGFVGVEEFTYTAQDAGLEGGEDPPAVDQDTATVVVEVLEDLIPDAVDDFATTPQIESVIIDVLENDSLGNASNAVEIETGPANGSATLQANDTIRYVPNITFIGEDTFEYRLTDANGDSDVATVTVGVFFVRGQVSIDIMPNSDGNNLNLRAGQGAGIDIAILSVGEFFEAPNVIDPLTLKFGPREANIWGSPQVRDVDGDGDEDLVVRFLIQQTGIPCGDTHANLFGRTFDFQPISGMDTINTFSCPRVRKRH